MNWVVVIVRQSWRVFLNHSVEWCGYSMLKTFDDMLNRFYRIRVCDRQTDGQTVGRMDGHPGTA